MSVRTDAEADDAQQTGTTESESTPTRISKDDAFHILQNARRRAVLRYILDHDQEEFVMRDVAEEVAAWEHDTTVQQLVSDERQRVYIALYQSHLPKLADHGVIEYNQSRGLVRTTQLTPLFDTYLEDGLHADSDLSIEDTESREDEHQSGLATAVSSLLNR